MISCQVDRFVDVNQWIHGDVPAPLPPHTTLQHPAQQPPVPVSPADAYGNEALSGSGRMVFESLINSDTIVCVIVAACPGGVIFLEGGYITSGSSNLEHRYGETAYSLHGMAVLRSR